MPRAMQCPFAQYYKGLEVRCEMGRLDFPSRDAWLNYVKHYCGHPHDWQGCTLAAELNAEYDREELRHAKEKH